MSLNPRAQYHFGDFTLTPAARRLTRAGEPVAVSPRAFDVLSFLVAHAGQVVTKEQLLKGIWPDSFVEESNLSQHVFALRRVLGDCAAYIVTVTGRGYQFAEPVREELLPDPEAAETVASRSVAALSADGVEKTAAGTYDETAWEAERAKVLSTGRPWIPIAAGVIAVAVVAGILLWKPHHVSSPAITPRIVIAELTNTTGNAALDGTLQQALEIDLGQSPFLDIMGRSETAQILSQMGRDPDKSHLTPDLAREVCERANRQMMLSGGVARVGNNYVLTLETTTCSGGKVLGGARHVAANEADLLRALDSAADKLRNQLGEDAQSIRSFDIPIEQATTPSLEALKAYSVATSMEAHGSETASVLSLYQRAVSFDPNFAMGYEGMANIYYALDEPKLAAEAARKAYDLSEHVSEREKFAIQTRYHADTEGNLPAAISTARLWAAAYPHDWTPWALIAGEYNDMGQYPQAIEAGRKALALSLDQALIYSDLARAERRANHFDEVKKLAEQARAHNALSPGLHGTLYQTAVAAHDAKLLAQEEQWGREHGGWFHINLQGNAAAAAGRFADFRVFMHQARQKALDNNLKETADAISMEEAATLYYAGFLDEARRTLPESHGNDISTRADLAVLAARLGNPAPARDFLHSQIGTIATQANFREIPRVSAMLALASGRPDAAINALEPALPYELQDFEVPMLRANVYLRMNKLAEAEREFRKITTKPGIDPLAIHLPLAHLQLARIYARLGDTAKSREEYQTLFTLWQNADPDLPLLQQAKQEAAARKN